MGKINKFLVPIVVVLIIAVALAGCTSGPTPEKPIKMRYPGQLPVGHVISNAMEDYAQLVEERTNGRVDIEVYPAGQLYSDPDMARILTGGEIELAMYTPIALAGITPVVSVNELWGLFDDWDHVKRYLAAGGRDLYDAGNKKANSKLLFLMPYGSNAGPISNKKPFKTLEDWKDMQVRCPGEVYAVALEALGAKPVYVAAGEVYQALQRGTIDSAVSGASSFYKRKWYEVAKYVTKARYTFTPFYTVACLDTWDKLPKDIQNIMLEAGREVEEGMYGPMLAQEDEAWAAMEAAGMEIYTLPPEEWARWIEQLKPVWNQWAEKSDLSADAIALAEETR